VESQICLPLVAGENSRKTMKFKIVSCIKREHFHFNIFIKIFFYQI